LSPPDRALCDYALKLTLVPGECQRQDVERLMAAEWTEEQIHLATQIVGYFNYINRVADGLGVDDEAWMKPPAQLSRQAWLEAKAKFDRQSV
jgi:uncharacterized protein YciW